MLSNDEVNHCIRDNFINLDYHGMIRDAENLIIQKLCDRVIYALGFVAVITVIFFI